MIVRLHTYWAFYISQLWSFDSHYVVIFRLLNDYQMTIE